MREKQIGGPIAMAVIAVVVLFALGMGYLFLNKDSLGQEGQPKKYNKPGEIPAGAKENVGPFPNNTPSNGQQMPATGVPGNSAPRTGTP